MQCTQCHSGNVGQYCTLHQRGLFPAYVIARSDYKEWHGYRTLQIISVYMLVVCMFKEMQDSAHVYF